MIVLPIIQVDQPKLQGGKKQFLKRCTDQFDRLYLEGAENARVMAISIHPYITGVPHRIKYLEALLDYHRPQWRCADDRERNW